MAMHRKTRPGCSNCGVEFQSEVDSFKEFRIVSAQEERSIGASEAIETIFEASINTKQKHISPGSLEMCFQCISLLAELFRYYMEFMEMTRETTYMWNLIEESIVWTQCGTKRKIPPEPLDSFIQDQEQLDEEINCDSSDEDEDPNVGHSPEDQDYDLVEDSVDVLEEEANDNEISAMIYGPRTRMSISRITQNIQEQVLELQQCQSEIPAELKIKRSKIGLALPGRTVFNSTRRTNSANTRTKQSSIGSKSKTPVTKKCQTLKFLGFKCHQCKETFRTQVKLESHFKKTSHSSDLVCRICKPNKSYTTPRFFRRHLKAQHGLGVLTDDMDARTCSVCLKVFNTPYQMRQHSIVHIDTKDFQCTQCDRLFSTELYLRNHVRNVHTTEAKIRFPCSQCETSYFSRGGLKRHNQDKHTDEAEKKYQVCEHCGKKFLRSVHLKSHLKTHLPNRIKSVPCPSCDKTFYNEGMLRSHMKTHVGSKDSLCPFCGDAFVAPRSLQRHIQVKHEEKAGAAPQQNICDLCGKSFKLREYLLQHLRAKSHGGDGHTAHKRKIALLEEKVKKEPG